MTAGDIAPTTFPTGTSCWPARRRSGRYSGARTANPSYEGPCRSAGNRMLTLELHPIENVERATREIRAHAPGASDLRDRERGRNDRGLRCPDHSIFVDRLRRHCARRGGLLGLRYRRIAATDASSERLGGFEHSRCLPPGPRREMTRLRARSGLGMPKPETRNIKLRTSNLTFFAAIPENGC